MVCLGFSVIVTGGKRQCPSWDGSQVHDFQSTGDLVGDGLQFSHVHKLITIAAEASTEFT